MQAKGIDFFAAKDFIENKGLYSMNDKVVMNNLNNPYYQNPLRQQGQMPLSNMMSPDMSMISQNASM